MLGNNFMRGFYIVYDREASRIGFAALTGSLKDEPCDAACAGGTATATATTELEWWVWLLIILAIVIVVVVVLVVVFVILPN